MCILETRVCATLWHATTAFNGSRDVHLRLPTMIKNFRWSAEIYMHELTTRFVTHQRVVVLSLFSSFVWHLHGHTNNTEGIQAWRPQRWTGMMLCGFRVCKLCTCLNTRQSCAQGIYRRPEISTLNRGLTFAFLLWIQTTEISGAHFSDQFPLVDTDHITENIFRLEWFHSMHVSSARSVNSQEFDSSDSQWN